MGEYRTDRSRAWRALVAGAATGAGMVALLFLSAIMRDEGVMGSVQLLPLVGLVFISAFAGWIIGLFALAAPAWWLLHRLKLRSLPAALVLGAVGAFLGHLGMEAIGFRAMNYTGMKCFLATPRRSTTAGPASVPPSR
jgi:hypothetical protein